MGTESHECPSVVHSSIALLQERFRQLQRMKEMREEKELINRMLAVAESNNKHYLNIHVKPTMYFEPACLFPKPQRAIQVQPQNQDSVSQWQSNVEYRSVESSSISSCTRPLMNLWPIDYDTPSSSSDASLSFSKLSEEYLCDSESDVDTSLHL
ncbi:hypothetical protein FNV43_RR07947 [Rhamnella rubrinervis]|uniref:Uncharacterized protein n=1 Tax=Rhamnella rubrinervis TaxID=2594499 RepID=A0A8K0MMM5_9ROSA|nr:hypothetical protein FNV43_RR07947 [Rhamnella rubrinervis]